MSDKLSILGSTQKEYSDAIFHLLKRGKYHASLLYSEFYNKGTMKGLAVDFTPTTNILLHEILNSTVVYSMEIEEKKDCEGVIKYLFKTFDNCYVESVLISMQSGYTLCVSSQVGCARGCVFCETGKQGLKRNLTTEEIVSQVYKIKVLECYKVNNIVFMGMGEPFDNYDNVMRSINILTEQRGLAFGYRSITVSTCGHVDMIKKFTEGAPFALNLAISLNAPNNQIRSKIMPINNSYSMEEIKKAVSNYCCFTKQKVLISYVLLKGINDRLEDAEELSIFLKGLDIKLNVIPYNGGDGLLEASSDESTESFVKYMRQAGFQVLLRRSKGHSIEAGCGQLRANCIKVND